ncbi:FtsW/RodA/SpoVE family cell cycle protein [Flexithrix dorotheae]|uniref:FtsW/RodA/SpoVE family cell cycle protein n=1 Tax=Flexithrix dorotheae TaxID=70993 RepID=UPI0003789747|nr:putative peptidoglycan glycosyltransferase FtsW [Flexithrix dorotheae]
MENNQTQSGYILQHLEGDKIIWMVTIILSLVSILVVYSATGNLAYRLADGNTEHFLMKHTVLILLAFGAMFICHRIDYRYYSRLSRYALLASVPLLIFAWQFGDTINGATRWVTIPFIDYSFQPSDFAKLALISNVASMLSKRQLSIKEYQKAISPLLIWVGIVCGLIGLSDLSSAALLFMTCSLLLFIGRVPVKYLGMMMIVGAMAGAFAFTFGQRGSTGASRLTSYMNDGAKSFQAEQSIIAINSGGIAGKGPGKSTQRNFLPHPYSDFIFAIIVEEYGLLGALAIIGAYLTLLYRGMLVVGKSSRAFGGLLVAGLTFSLIVQAFVHMGVVVGVFPITGLPLPLLSMGGTSLVFTGVTMGMILSVSRAVEMDEEGGDLVKRGNSRKREKKPVFASNAVG